MLVNGWDNLVGVSYPISLTYSGHAQRLAGRQAGQLVNQVCTAYSGGPDITKVTVALVNGGVTVAVVYAGRRIIGTLVRRQWGWEQVT